jgi:hypothetical protein
VTCACNICDPSEDVWPVIAYQACGRPASRLIYDRLRYRETPACDEHAAAAEQDGWEIR